MPFFRTTVERPRSLTIWLAGAVLVCAFTATTISAQVLTAVSLSPLTFGTVFPGISKSVSRTSPSAEYFFINGTPPREINITLTLPSTLSNGGAQMPISFSSSDAGINYLNVQSGATQFDPNVAYLLHLRPPAGNEHIWLGGTVSPSAGQASGTYTGSIIITTFYTGN